MKGQAKESELRWSDADASGHVRHGACGEIEDQARIARLEEGGLLAAEVTAAGDWLELGRRRLVPPGPVAELVRGKARAEPFGELPAPGRGPRAA
jgi:hypothetical protein